MSPSPLSVQNDGRNKLVVLSPCSSCKNHRKTFTEEGFWPCPRRIWEERLKTQTNGSAVPDYLVATGSKDEAYANPVYAEDLKMIVVWTASLDLNCGLYTHAKGKQVTPHILDPNFDSTYIKCSELPSMILETEASYYQSGAYKEGEIALKMAVQPFQYVDSQQPTMIDGFVKRTDVMFQPTFQTQDEDVVISGM